jgi:heat shock protein beta
LPNVIAVLYSFRYVWESKADGSFAISEDTWNEPLGRGTEIRLHLRDEAKEYLEEDKLKVSTHSFVFCLG